MAGGRSVRAEKAALRERIRTAGLGHDRVAAELGRRYGLRPRAAWREAQGWSLTEGASQINEHAARSGLDPAGVASMTVSHLSEYETWPGPAALDGDGPVAGRKPGPYLLALLARVYGCTVADLVDVADREHLPPADLLLIDEFGQQPQRQDAARVPAAPGSQVVPLSPAARGVPAVLRDRARAGLLADRHGGGVPPLPGLAYGEMWERRPGVSRLEYEVVMTAHEGSEHAEQAEQRDIGDTALADIRADIVAVSREYMTGQPFPVLQRMGQVRSRIYAALDRRIWPRDSAELYFDAALINYQMAVAANDLGYPQSADKLIRAAWTYAMIIDHRPLMARLRGEAAAIAYWDGRPRQARDHAAAGLTYFSDGQHGALINVIGAWASAAIGDADAVHRAIAAASTSHERDYSDELLEMGGQFGCSWATQHYCAGSALLELPSGASNALAELERAAELYAAGPGADEHHSEAMRMRTHADLATARLRTGDLDAAIDSLEAVLALPSASRTGQITRRLSSGVRVELAGRRFQGSAQAAELDERIEEFGRETIVAALHDLPGGAG